MTEPVTETNEPLLAFILSVLTPFLTTASPADAIRAAQQTIAAYKAAGQDQLITIAQIVGFAFASLDNLRLSAAADMSVAMKLRLRGNANALSQSTRRSTTTLETQRRETPAEPDESLAVTETPAASEPPNPAPSSPVPADPPPFEATQQPEQDPRHIWANAMTEIAAECARDLARLPPGQRRAETIRISALTDTARHLRQGGPIPTRSDLSSGTSLTAPHIGHE